MSMINISSVEDYQKSVELNQEINEDPTVNTPKEVVKRAFERGYTIRLGALNDIMEEVEAH
ncbi:MAG: hypothetical protein CL760_09120 [Chloroflexi bacterium]|nr:hypothetical protein [Chloroflexota bacterium]